MPQLAIYDDTNKKKVRSTLKSKEFHKVFSQVKEPSASTDVSTRIPFKKVDKHHLK